MFFGDAGSRLTAALLAAALLCGADGGALAAERDPCHLQEGSNSGDGRIIVGGGEIEHCAPPETAAAFYKCRDAGWGSVVFPVGGVIAVLCNIPIRNFADGADAAEVNSCGIGGNPTSPCEDVFGAELNFPENEYGVEQRFIYNCPEHTGPDPAYVSGGVQGCIPLSAEGVCENLFGGMEKDEGGGKICSGADSSGTFCIIGSHAAFPCRGLFRHVWRCNREHHRPAENPFICGKRCDMETEIAKGAKCIQIPSDN